MSRLSATPVDRAFQLAYRGAYRMMRMYWSILHPSTHGALVMIWNAGEVLLVRNSYVNYYSLPGGYVHAQESARDAARRELREEIELELAADQLVSVLDEHHEWEGKREHIEIFSVELDRRPVLEIDRREVIEAAWFPATHALALELFPPIRKVLEARLSARV